jgi:uncharacterized membrane protein
MRSINPQEFLSRQETALVEQAVRQAEAGTSAQIKFVVARHCWGRAGDKAVGVFKKMGLHKTAHRNCVLILLVTTNREFAIFGDRGIHAKAGQGLWDGVRDHMARRFGEGALAEGVAEGIGMIGQKLAEFFPHEEGAANEISDEVGYQP